MKFCILVGSPREKGNTSMVLEPFIQELKKNKAQVELITLNDKEIRPCQGCFLCQKVPDTYGCVQKDDTAAIMEQILEADCTVFATPIYAFFCTAPMKALMDRHMGMNKFYGTGEPRRSLWQGKKMAIITTHTYDTAYAAEPFETGMKHFCQHSLLNYAGMYSVSGVRKKDFLCDDVKKGAEEFARTLLHE